MKFILFKHNPPKRFSYKPRYWDQEKDEIEKRKASLGLRSEVNREDRMRSQMRKKWRSSEDESKNSLFKKVYLFYGVFIFIAVYVIFFTDFVYKLIALFGIK